jgi:type 1 fimbria pilin
MRFRTMVACFVMFALAGAMAQNIVTGGISGTVTDPTGAIVPGAKVTLKSTNTGETQTSSTGVHRFVQLPAIEAGNLFGKRQPAWIQYGK